MLQDAETIPESIRAAKDSIEWTVKNSLMLSHAGASHLYGGRGQRPSWRA